MAAVAQEAGGGASNGVGKMARNVGNGHRITEKSKPSSISIHRKRQLQNMYIYFFQTEGSLANLQKSIHPLTLQKLRGLLFLKEEEDKLGMKDGNKAEL